MAVDVGVAGKRDAGVGGPRLAFHPRVIARAPEAAGEPDGTREGSRGERVRTYAREARQEKPGEFSRDTSYCIDAMNKFPIGWPLKGFFADHDVQERLTKESGLDDVIARPTRLTTGKANGTYKRTPDVGRKGRSARGLTPLSAARSGT